MINFDEVKYVMDFISDKNSIYSIYDENTFDSASKFLDIICQIDLNLFVLNTLFRKNADLKYKDIPMYSNFDDCSINMVESLEAVSNKGVDMERLGFLLAGKEVKKGALYKYGESHSKAASLLGLAIIKKEEKNKVFLTNLGYYYLINKEKRSLITPRLLLRLNVISTLLQKSLHGQTLVTDCMNMFSISSINRRLPNVKTMYMELTKTKEFNFSHFTDNLIFKHIQESK